jgi:hypothetical protein
MRGVIGLLSFGGVPAVISDQEIEAGRVVVRSSSNNVEPWGYLRGGQYVRIEYGPLWGARFFGPEEKQLARGAFD